MTRPIKDRFWEKVDKSFGLGPNGDCWEWTAFMDYGYGRFKIGKKSFLSHRVSWILINGDPGDLHVLHKCDNRCCVNPDHLFLGTNADNMKDRNDKGRQSKGIKHGDTVRGEKCGTSKLTDQQVKEIRQRCDSGEKIKSIVKDYDVSAEALYDIKNKKSWIHI